MRGEKVIIKHDENVDGHIWPSHNRNEKNTAVWTELGDHPALTTHKSQDATYDLLFWPFPFLVPKISLRLDGFGE